MALDWILIHENDIKGSDPRGSENSMRFMSAAAGNSRALFYVASISTAVHHIPRVIASAFRRALSENYDAIQADAY